MVLESLIIWDITINASNSQIYLNTARFCQLLCAIVIKKQQIAVPDHKERRPKILEVSICAFSTEILWILYCDIHETWGQGGVSRQPKNSLNTPLNWRPSGLGPNWPAACSQYTREVWKHAPRKYFEICGINGMAKHAIWVITPRVIGSEACNARGEAGCYYKPQSQSYVDT